MEASIARFPHQSRGRGRPTKLTPKREGELVRLLAGGSTVTTAAVAVGIDRRTLQLWRSRAWSRHPADRVYVRFEQRLQAARVEAARREAVPVLELDWQAAARRLEAEYEHWQPPTALEP